MGTPSLWTSGPLFGVSPESAGSDSWLHMIVRKDLAEINMLLEPEAQNSVSLLMDMGEFLCRASEVLAQLSQRMAYGDHIYTFARLNINQMRSQTDLSELGSLDHVTALQKSLSEMAGKLNATSQDIKRHWRSSMLTQPGPATVYKQTPALPMNQANYYRTSSQSSSPPEPRYPYQARATTTTDGSMPPAPPVASAQDPVEARIHGFLAKLDHRGTGQYSCPYGQSCDKTGVARDGSLVLYQRNCEFKAHLEKHVKRYVCTLPGCPSKGGFARPDLLKRHQDRVRHSATAGNTYGR